MTLYRDSLHDIPDGDPIVGNPVNLYSDDDVLLGTANTNADGTFSIEVAENPGPAYYLTSVGGVTKRHTTTSVMPVGILDLSAMVPFLTVWDNGVNPEWGGALRVTNGVGMSAYVADGAAIIDGMPFARSTVKTVTIDAAHATLGRIDLIYLAGYGSASTNPGKFEIAYLAGTPAASPAAPTPTVTNGAYIELARVTVDAAVTSIASDKITDRREFTAPSGQATGAKVVSDMSVDSVAASISAGTTPTVLDTCTIPALVSGQLYKIQCKAFVDAEGVAALADGRLGILVAGGTRMDAPTQRWEHGVDTTHQMYHKENKTGAGATVDVSLYYTRVSGTIDFKYYGIEAVAYPV